MKRIDRIFTNATPSFIFWQKILPFEVSTNLYQIVVFQDFYFEFVLFSWSQSSLKSSIVHNINTTSTVQREKKLRRGGVDTRRIKGFPLVWPFKIMFLCCTMWGDLKIVFRMKPIYGNVSVSASRIFSYVNSN